MAELEEQTVLAACTDLMAMAMWMTLGTWGHRAGDPNLVDLDDDGLLDVAILGAAQSSGSDLIVFWGDGLRAFDRRDETLPTYPVDPRGQIFVADLEGDGRSDVLMNGGLAAIAGGDRRFVAETMRASDKTIETVIAVVDVDANGKRDLVGTLQAPSEDDSQLCLVPDLANGAVSTPLRSAPGRSTGRLSVVGMTTTSRS